MKVYISKPIKRYAYKRINKMRYDIAYLRGKADGITHLANILETKANSYEKLYSDNLITW